MKKILITLSCALLAVACTSHDRTAEISAIEQREAAIASIEVGTDSAEPAELSALYRQFAAHFPDDSLAPVYLQRAADLDINLGRYDQAISCLDSIVSLYPGFDDLGGCLFLIGYAHEQAEQFDAAREAYQRFVDTYPDHYLAADTRKMIPFVGLSPEEMFEMLISNATDNNLAQD